MRRTASPLPYPTLFAVPVAAGFPSPADDYIDKPLCLNELLVPRPAATYFIRMPDDSMIGAHFHRGDLLVVDRSLRPGDGRIVVAKVAGELMVRRLVVRGQRGWLHAVHPDHLNIELKEGLDYRIMGVVRWRVHAV